jgi:hypothetical protein
MTDAGWQFRGDFAELGEGQVTMLACPVPVEPLRTEYRDAVFTIVFSSGVLFGTGSGEQVIEPGGSGPGAATAFTHFDIAFNGGTGAFADASGAATWDETAVVDVVHGNETTNEFTGSITVLAA